MGEIELPILKRCCFCMPLKEGLVVFGIVKLISVVITIILMTYFYCGGDLNSCYDHVQIFHETLQSVLFGLLNFLSVIDFLFTVMMLIGAISRHAMLLNISYYYTIVSMVIFLLIGGGVVSLQIFALATEKEGSIGTLFVILLVIFEIAVSIPVLMFEFYMFLLIRSLTFNYKVTGEINFNFTRSDNRCLLVMEKNDNDDILSYLKLDKC